MRYNKKIIKIIFLSILTVAFFTIIAIFLAFANAKNTVAVLNYHQVNDKDDNALTVKVKDFEEQMRYLAENNYNVITPSEMTEAFKNNEKLPEKTVIITFDDGYKDNYENAYPILKKYNLKGTIFVITDYVSLYPNYITWDEAKEMQASGVINLESHTMDHLNLLKIGKNEARFQLSNSKYWLEAHLKKPVSFVAYPEGDYNEDIKNILKELKYEGAFTVNYGLVSKDSNAYEMPRVAIFGHQANNFKRFKQRLEYAPIFIYLEDLKYNLSDIGLTKLANIIYVP